MEGRPVGMIRVIPSPRLFRPRVTERWVIGRAGVGPRAAGMGFGPWVPCMTRANHITQLLAFPCAGTFSCCLSIRRRQPGSLSAWSLAADGRLSGAFYSTSYTTRTLVYGDWYRIRIGVEHTWRRPIRATAHSCLLRYISPPIPGVSAVPAEVYEAPEAEVGC